MKKSLFLAVLILPFFTIVNSASANNTPIDVGNSSTSPVVSIGVGNGNNPENLGPVHLGVYHGEVPVYGTITDDDIESYHLRVIKDAGLEGHSCTEELGLFSENNQGHASTTLGKTTCGFPYNKAVFISEGFSNMLLTMVSTIDLGSFSGEGDYWFVLGAKDLLGNRTNVDYLQDSKVKITIDNTPPITNGTVLVTGIEGPFTIQTTATDDHGVASTTVYSATSDGINCGLFSQAISLSANGATTSSLSVAWTPMNTGTYCVGVASQDLPGNVEQIKTLTTGINFVAQISTTTATSTPGNTGTTTPQTGNGGSGSTNTEGNGSSGTGSGSGSSGSGGGNGPIVGLLGTTGGSISNPIIPNQNFVGGNGPVSYGGIGGDGTALDNLNSGSRVSGENNAGNNGSATTTIIPKTKKNSIGVKSDSNNSTTTSTTTSEFSTSTDQLALAGLSGFNLNWLWLLIVAMVLAGGYYVYSRD